MNENHEKREVDEMVVSEVGGDGDERARILRVA